MHALTSSLPPPLSLPSLLPCFLASFLSPHETFIPYQYSDAIKRDPKVSAFYSNRAAAYQKVMEYARAKEDCQKAIELEKNNVKAWGRLGDVQFFQKEYHRALESYENGMRAAERTDANGDHCRDGMVRTRMKIQVGSALDSVFSFVTAPSRSFPGAAADHTTATTVNSRSHRY